MEIEGHISYVEFAARDPAETRQFFEQVFNWQFTDYGPDYTSFSDCGLAGGFYRAPLAASAAAGSALVVIYTEKLEDTLARVEAAGGVITRPIFAFPGGHRFHFTEPGGNELAVWSDQQG